MALTEGHIEWGSCGISIVDYSNFRSGGLIVVTDIIVS